MARSLLLHRHMTAGKKARRSSREAGFTLVELGAVVTIVGILSVVAVLAYRKYMLNAKITEAQNVLSAIKIAQEDFRTERGTYADIGATYCPSAAGIHNRKVGWDPECSGGGSFSVPRWKSLPVHVNGAVQFKYATVANTGTYTAPSDAAWVTVNAPPAGPWYVAMARCDLDGAPGTDTQLVTMSFTNQIFSQNEGH